MFYYLTNKLVLCITLIDVIERCLLGLAIYQFIIFLTLTYINDARKDAFLALKSAYNMALLYCETGNRNIKDHLVSKIEGQLDPSMLNHTDIRAEYAILSKLLETRDIIELKRKLIIIEHCYEEASLQWRYALLLRIFK